MTKKDPIGIFDSGVGGLTVADKVLRFLPGEKIVYFGDTARLPYGNKSKETVTRFSKEIVSFLLQFRVKLIIVACNTASSLSLDVLKRSFDVPLLGVIRPGVREALNATRSGRIGVIGTEATVLSNAYRKEVAAFSKKVFVIQKSCPLFVPLVENRWQDTDIAFKIARKYLSPMVAKKIDTLILACTHYPLLKTVIKRAIGKKVQLIDSSDAVVNRARDILKNKALVNDDKRGTTRFFASDDTKKFEKLAKMFLKKGIKAKKVIF